VSAKTYRRLELAYLSKGEVHMFHVKTQLAPLVIDYQEFDDLSQDLVAQFEDHAAAKGEE
jgi:hypothetical protein